MHSYLKTIGFSSLSKAELNEILEEVVKNYDEKYVAESHPEHLYVSFLKITDVTVELLCVENMMKRISSTWSTIIRFFAAQESPLRKV